MREALIVWGGWERPRARAVRRRRRRHCCEDEGFEVRVENSHRGLRRPGDRRPQPDRADHHDVDDREGRGRRTSRRAIARRRRSRRLPRRHGRRASARRSTTSSWSAASGSPTPATSSTTASTSPGRTTRSWPGIDDFAYRSEQYYMHVDPGERGAGDDDLHRRARRLDRRRRHAGGLEAPPRQGPRLLLLARPQGRGAGPPAGLHHPPPRPPLGSPGLTAPTPASGP